MKNLISFCLLFSLCTSSFAQKCKEENDPITNEKKVVFKDDRLGVWLELKNGNLQFTLRLGYSGVIQGKAPKGLEFLFKLENGDLITLKNNSEITGKSNVSAYGATTSYDFVFDLSKEDAIKFNSGKVVFARIPKVVSEGSDDCVEKSILVKFQLKKSFKKGIACMVTYL